MVFWKILKSFEFFFEIFDLKIKKILELSKIILLGSRKLLSVQEHQKCSLPKLWVGIEQKGKIINEKMKLSLTFRWKAKILRR